MSPSQRGDPGAGRPGVPGVGGRGSREGIMARMRGDPCWEGDAELGRGIREGASPSPGVPGRLIDLSGLLICWLGQG